MLIPVYTMHLRTVHLCAKLQPSRLNSFWEKCDEKFNGLNIGEKDKWRNKGTNKQQRPEYGIHNTSVNYPPVCQVSILMFENWRERKMKK